MFFPNNTSYRHPSHWLGFPTSLNYGIFPGMEFHGSMKKTSTFKELEISETTKNGKQFTYENGQFLEDARW